jgi:hypothetical protein
MTMLASTVQTPMTYGLINGIDGNAMGDNTYVPTTTSTCTLNDSTSEVFSSRFDEAEVPEWVYDRVSSLKLSDGSFGTRARRDPSTKKTMRVLTAAVPELSIAEVVQLKFNELGCALMNVRCQCGDQRLEITGTVGRFYHLQMAIEAARKVAEGRRIEVQVKVITPSISQSSSD